ncbi:hypothetical protein H6P81_013323 [Aristolochia fimbriata]|uniref:Reverse transcriptase RNase H-like domain-containing protein n=1 Tax=Aristolochia fimbriata TaxID=158543 RepID=A0AAV7EED9_ARIFI|nr:hypothetical protein H6P81_013323 [Aristolochia fimbriata]
MAVNHILITDDDEQGDDEFILKDAPTAFKGGQSTVNDLKKIKLGSEEDPRPTILSASLAKKEEAEYISLLQEYRDVFTWNYTEMSTLDPNVVVHKLAIHPSVRPLVPEIEKEVDKLIAVNFIREVKYPSWIANIVPVKKKSGQIRVCVNFRNLNKACPKDDIPLLITELMVDATTGHEVLSFMDGSSVYNQIHMDPKDEELMAFQTPKDIFCYKVMPFGLKNAGATYPRAMQHIFTTSFTIVSSATSMIWWSKQRSKLTISSISEPCLIDSVLVAPIVGKPLLLYISAQENSMGALLVQNDENNKERSFYNLSRTLVGTELNYMPIEKTCLALIIAVQKLRHYLLAHLTYLLSRADPLKYIMLRPILSGRLAKWALLLSEFEINFVPQRAIKGQALENFLVDHPVPVEWELMEEFPDENIFLVEILPPWKMYFDGAARRNRAGGVLFARQKMTCYHTRSCLHKTGQTT